MGWALLEGSVPHLSKDSGPGDLFYECLGQKFQSKPETVKRDPFFFFLTIPETVVGASNLTAAGGLDHSVLGMEIIS